MINKLKEKKSKLEATLLLTDSETQRINALEIELNALIQQRDAKASFNFPIQKEISKIDEVIGYLEKLENTEEVTDE